ncbi:energy transducer TonB [Hymenobacter sp. BT683]|uniref:Energy transducer TonB n=1 Tax=Hymenobacter jeongseonensis TaxID=2791027 RepID=A0ABS0INM2_9BACT|nr:energy transducer TonB [Hymenobacter jeongseonensis]MBF9239921.1 energy transducer TonB [Hymenobacter jeongseonensis]
MLRYLVSAGVLLTAMVERASAQTAAVASTVPVPEPGGVVRPGPTAPLVYFTADEMPTFPGGDRALLTFLASRLNYPTAALDRSLSGKVYLTFTVDPEGRLHNPRVVRGLGAGLDEEALRLVRLMPWWNPGKIGGQPVWVTLTMPISFRAL